MTEQSTGEGLYTPRRPESAWQSVISTSWQARLSSLLLLSYLIRRVQPCGYDALIYMLRTLGPVSFLHLSVFSTCILVRSSSFISGFVRSPIRVLLPDLSAEKKRSWNGGGEWLKGINGIHGCGSNLNSAPVLPPLCPLSCFFPIFPIPTRHLSRLLSVGATLVWLLLLT